LNLVERTNLFVGDRDDQKAESGIRNDFHASDLQLRQFCFRRGFTVLLHFA
jgi:hypothetical protein